MEQISCMGVRGPHGTGLPAVSRGGQASRQVRGEGVAQGLQEVPRAGRAGRQAAREGILGPGAQCDDTAVGVGEERQAQGRWRVAEFPLQAVGGLFVLSVRGSVRQLEVQLDVEPGHLGEGLAEAEQAQITGQAFGRVAGYDGTAHQA
ncbi:hypothetical protein CTZ27_35305 [Streptomyces griseocarneus]|nr:hypothetical protein CTZ27_35305 [Streptomyces griseocarneus]